MARTGTVLPAFLKLEFDGTGNGATDFERPINTAFNSIDRQVARFQSLYSGY